jgi:zinc protease
MVLSTYIIKSNRTSGIFKPEKMPLRAVIEKAPPISSFIGSLPEDDSIGLGGAFIASVNNIEQHIERHRISDAAKIAIFSKKTRGQMVRANARFRFGDETVLTPLLKEFWLVPSMLWRGTKLYNYQAIRDKVDSLMSTLDIDGHAGLLLASIKTERDYVGPMVDLLQHILKNSTFDAGEFALVRQREIDNYEEVKNDPQRLGFHELDRMKHPYGKGHIHYVYSYDEIIDGLKILSIDRIKEAYYNIFSAENYFCSVVGDIEDDKILSQLQQLGKDENPKIFTRIKRPFIKNIAGQKVLDTPDKEMGIIAMAFNFPMRDDHPDYVALKLANYLFGETMNSRLVNRIREKEGISYGAGSGIEISRHEENASLSIYAMSSPESMRRAQTAISEEWNKILQDGFLESELAVAKESIWLSFENSLANDGFLAAALAHDLECDRDFYMRQQKILTMKDLTLADLNNAMHKWWLLSSAEFSKVLAYDQKRAGLSS